MLSAQDSRPRPADRARRLGRAVRRRVLAHRRPLAALLAALAVAAALRVIAPPEPATTMVLVAARDLSAGTVLGSDDLVTSSLPEQAVPDGSTDDAEGRILAAPVRRGEPLTDVRLVGPALAASGAGTVTAPLRLPDPDSVALLQPGDRIDLLATDPRRGQTTRIADGAVVLAVPPTEDTTVTGPLGGRVVLLALPPGAVEAALSAAVRAFLSFVYSD